MPPFANVEGFDASSVARFQLLNGFHDFKIADLAALKPLTFGNMFG